MVELASHPAYELLERYRKKGLVVDYVLLRASGGEADPHRSAALAGMAVIAARWEAHAQRTLRTYPRMKRAQFRTLVWEDRRMAREAVAAEAFFAEPDTYYETRPEISQRCISWEERQSYAYAFLEPPYGASLLTGDWRALNAVLFSGPENLDIYAWNTGWSNYFDDGHEWWGAYYWTVYDRGRDCYVVIAASATD